jgi:hypothetical protein
MTAGLDLLTAAQITGNSVAMIEKDHGRRSRRNALAGLAST